jgi:hypothetical protein
MTKHGLKKSKYLDVFIVIDWPLGEIKLETLAELKVIALGHQKRLRCPQRSSKEKKVG